MITVNDILQGSKFQTTSGIVWIIDSIEQDNGLQLVRTSMEGGEKGRYMDEISEVVSFLNEENSIKVN